MKASILLIFFGLTVNLHGQTVNDRLIKANNSDCFVMAQNFFPIDSLSVIWNGPCKNQKANGNGTLTYFLSKQEVATYNGAVLNGSTNGIGKFSSPNGFKWEGQFVNGVLNGTGKVIFPDPAKKLVGHFSDGEILNVDPTYRTYLKKNIISTNDSTRLYENDRNQNDLFYYSLIPPGKIKGVIVLFPGTWDRVEYTISSAKMICQKAFDNSIAVISISINQRLTLHEDALGTINLAFRDAISKYRLTSNKFILGGFSMGGLFSLRYTEMAKADSSKTAVIPVAAFSVDGPTDLEKIYGSFERALERSPNKSEPTYALNEFRTFIGGTPKTHPEKYVYYSVFSNSQNDGGNAKYLLHTPIRIYNDVDVRWWLENRNTDLYGMNALDQSAMINYLKRSGNKEAVFINAFGKGYRLDGTRHPHTWSIVDAEDLIQWPLKILK